MIDTSARNFDINLNINIKNIKTRYQYQYQYCRTQNSITISIKIPKIVKFKLNLKTIPRYLDILQSQDNNQKIRASIAHLWYRGLRMGWPLGARRSLFQIGFGCVMSHHHREGLCTILFKFWRENSKWSSCQQLVSHKHSL